MDIAAVIHQYADHDLWANTRIVDRLSREPLSVLQAPVKSSFPSLLATLMHLRNAHNVWLQRMRGVPQTWPAEPGETFDSFLVHVQAMHGFVLSLTNSDLLAEVRYEDLKGNPHTTTRWEALMHAFNHATYHRGQLITMMRTLGMVDLPATDLINYQRSLR